MVGRSEWGRGGHGGSKSGGWGQGFGGGVGVWGGKSAFALWGLRRCERDEGVGGWVLLRYGVRRGEEIVGGLTAEVAGGVDVVPEELLEVLGFWDGGQGRWVSGKGWVRLDG